MWTFFKDNIVLTIGICLPLLLLILFVLAGTLPKYFVANPQYDFLFSDSAYNKQFSFVVIDQKLQVDISSFDPKQQKPTLYRYFAKTGTVKEIFVTLPNITIEKPSKIANDINANIVVSVDPKNLPSTEQAQNVSKVVSEMRKQDEKPSIIPIAELADIKLDSSVVSPDGYTFLNYGANSYNGILFSSRDNTRESIISKNGRKIQIPNTYTDYYRQPIFLGWIIP